MTEESSVTALDNEILFRCAGYTLCAIVGTIATGYIGIQPDLSVTSRATYCGITMGTSSGVALAFLSDTRLKWGLTVAAALICGAAMAGGIYKYRPTSPEAQQIATPAPQ